MDMESEQQIGHRGPADTVIAGELASELGRIRSRTQALVEPLTQEQLSRQVRRFMSPLIWDIGHIAHFERLWLIDAVEGRMDAALKAEFDALHTPRSQRGELEMPRKEASLEMLAAARADVLSLLASARLDGGDSLLRDGYVYRMVIQHEAQHQETMLQTLDLPADDWRFGRATSTTDAEPSRDIDDEARVEVPAGEFVMGTADRARAYDNERPLHAVHVGAFDMERYPVTNRRWLEFVSDAGYERQELWSAAGWQWLQGSASQAPQGWYRDDAWRLVRLGEKRPLEPREPVQHVSYWEAEAFATWAGGSLPSEAQWEKAAAWDVDREERRAFPWGHDVGAARGLAVDLSSAPDTARWGPPPVGRRPDLASSYGVEDLLGSVYQWTRSSFSAYPDFEAFPYDEYSAVFFGDTYRVLRGSSWAADRCLWRTSYRNWDLPERRQIFSGVRLVYER